MKATVKIVHKEQVFPCLMYEPDMGDVVLLDGTHCDPDKGIGYRGTIVGCESFPERIGMQLNWCREYELVPFTGTVTLES
jgi:hypothetical protein